MINSCTTLFKEENMKEEHKFNLLSLVRFNGDSIPDIEETDYLRKAFYSGKPLFVIDQTRDCDGTVLYSISTLPFDDDNDFYSYAVNTLLGDRLFSNLKMIEGGCLLNRLKNSMIISGVSESELSLFKE